MKAIILIVYSHLIHTGDMCYMLVRTSVKMLVVGSTRQKNIYL